MLNKSTIPPVIIEPGIYGSVNITKNKTIYKLSHNNIEWNVYNEKNMREYYEQWSGYDLAYGDVLLTGFGFGQMATWVAFKPEVKSVTVIEKCPDILTAFLANNKMPDNITVIIDDANTYSTNKKYDCIIYDHISNGLKESFFYEQLGVIVKNIPHNLFWFWSIELYYLSYFYNMELKDLYVNPVDFNKFDFQTKWFELQNKLGPTIPNLLKDKIDSYINSFFLRHLIQ